jgi:hypothetical protein
MAVPERGVGFRQMIPDEDFYETVRLESEGLAEREKAGSEKSASSV